MKPADIGKLKKTTDLVAVVQARGVKLARKGNDFVGLCPFHEEKEPSFHVTPSKNLFHCFGCGAAGSVIDFVMRKDGITFRQAVDLLLTKTGVVQRAEPIKPAPAISQERFQLLLTRVLSIYEKNFTDMPEGRAYLEKRGVTDAGLFTQYRVGYCNGRLLEILPKSGPVLDELKSLGILLPDGRERFIGCVVFPVCDVEGKLTTLYGRQAGPGPNKRHFYLPGRPTGLWNAPACKVYSSLILVESIIDALSVRMAGLDNVVSIQGTEGLNESDLQLFKDYGVQKLSLLLDGDQAGKAAVEKLFQKLSSFSCQVLSLPDGHDPNSYLVERGPAELAKIIAASPEPGPQANGSRPCLVPGGFALNLGLRRYEIRGLEKGPRKLKATVRVEHGGKLHVDTLDFYSARWRRQLVQDLTRIFDELPDTLESDISKLISFCEGSEASNHQAGPGPIEAMSPESRADAEAFGKSRDLFEKILADFELCGLIGERANKLLCYLASISRKMEKPLSVLILSSSGAGKTMLQDTALLFCPPEDLVKLTSLSGKALFYKEQSSLKHKVLALEEGDGVEEATYALRNLISAGELVIESTIKDLVTGRLTTMENRVEGPTAVFVTTTNPETDPETKSRFFVTSVDESREQTGKILASQRRRQTLVGLAETVEMDLITARHRNFQRLLKPLAVVNPYADQLEYGDDRLQSRRDQPKYLNLIKAVAFLRQMQKQARHWGLNGQARAYIEVDLEDIQLANDLASQLLGHSLDELSRPGFDLLMQLEKMGQAGPAPNGETAKRKSFTRREIREFTGWSNARVHRYLKELLELEYVILENGRNGTLQTYRLLYDGQGKDGKRFVLGLKGVDRLKTPAPLQ